jgi:hypothetical protein
VWTYYSALRFEDTNSNVFGYRDLGESRSSALAEGSREQGGGETATLVPDNHFFNRFLHAESRLSGGGSISLVGCKNVPVSITER